MGCKSPCPSGGGGVQNIILLSCALRILEFPKPKGESANICGSLRKSALWTLCHLHTHTHRHTRARTRHPAMDLATFKKGKENGQKLSFYGQEWLFWGSPLDRPTEPPGRLCGSFVFLPSQEKSHRNMFLKANTGVLAWGPQSSYVRKYMCLSLL